MRLESLLRAISAMREADITFRGDDPTMKGKMFAELFCARSQLEAELEAEGINLKIKRTN